MPDAPRRSRRAQQAILEAATELVAEVGYRRLTIEAIAKRAGVGKQTIYRWWPSKGAVVLDAFMLAQEDAGATTLPETDDLECDLRELLRETARGLQHPLSDGPYRALTTEMQHDEQLAEEVRKRLLGPLLELTRQRLERAQARGQVRADADLAVAVELCYGPLFHRWLLGTGPLDDHHAEAVAAHVARAIGP